MGEADLGNVTPDQVKSILRNVRNGQLDDQDRLFRLMIDTWPRLRKAINEVAGSISRLPLEISPSIRKGEEHPTPEATRLHELVTRGLECSHPKPGHWEFDLEGAIRALVDAYVKGVAVIEIVWHYDHEIIAPRCYAPVPAIYVAYPKTTNQIDRLMLSPQGTAMAKLVDFPDNRFLIGTWVQGGLHPIHAANLRALSKYWLASVYGLGWLMQYAQLFGVPWRHVETDGSDEAMNMAEKMLSDIGSSGWAVTGPGVDLNLHEGVKSSGDSLPQSHMMDVADRACDILLLGQTLTSDNTGTGSRALGEVHASVRVDILNGVASWIGSILTHQLVPAIIHHNFGEDVEYEDMPTISLEVDVVKDKKEIAETFKILMDAGVPMPRKWAYDELGIPLPEEGEETLSGKEEMEPQISQDEDEEDDPLDIDDAGVGELYDLEAVRKEVDLQPTSVMASNARDALEERRTRTESERGMTAVGVARARDITNRTTLSPDTVRKMSCWFAKHESDKSSPSWNDKGKGWQAWHGWGGDHGKKWADSKVAELEAKE